MINSISSFKKNQVAIFETHHSSNISVPLENAVQHDLISPMEDEPILNSGEQIPESPCLSKLCSIRKTRPEEPPFEFKASLSPDVITNPDWVSLVHRSKGKTKKLKKGKISGAATSPEESSKLASIP